jgi:hypothetical protein
MEHEVSICQFVDVLDLALPDQPHASDMSSPPINNILLKDF